MPWSALSKKKITKIEQDYKKSSSVFKNKLRADVLKNSTQKHNKNSQMHRQNSNFLNSLGDWMEKLFTSCAKLLPTKKISENPSLFINLVASVLFVVLVVHLANLQIWTHNQVVAGQTFDTSAMRKSIVPSLRGQVYISDLARNQSKVPLTSTQLLANLSIDALELKKVINKKNNLEQIAQALAGSLNLPYQRVLDTFKVETSKDNLSRYNVIQPFITESQRRTAEYLIDRQNDSNSYSTWLRVEEVVKRAYPQGNLLASTIGYMAKYNISTEEAMKTECRESIVKNKDNGAEAKDYQIGYYGIEQKYCDLLMGSNGKNIFVGGNLQSDLSLPVKNGYDIYLTIDQTIQQKAEDLLAKAIKENSNENGAPRDGSIVVINPQTGKILAMASYPTFDPNDYSKVSDPRAYQNVAGSVGYEIGSSMKPLTVAAARNEWDNNVTGSKGQRLGVPEDWKKVDYNSEGKIYTDSNGTKLSIRNSQNISYSNRDNDLKVTLRDSINTMISDITDSMGNARIKDYLVNKFEFGQPTEAAFAGGGSGNLSGLDTNLQCQFCYAQHGFGQGFYIAPMQLIRAYTALANKGRLVEPYLIDKVIDGDGIVDDGTIGNSKIKRKDSIQIFRPQVAKEVARDMKSIIDEGYLGTNPHPVEGYSISAKTGTAQVSRPLIDKNTKKETYCDYNCNTARGIFDHTLIGFGPTENAQVMVLVKLSEPKPGQITNFADTTSMPTFREMMKFSLEYLQVPRDR